MADSEVHTSDMVTSDNTERLNSKFKDDKLYFMKFGGLTRLFLHIEQYKSDSGMLCDVQKGQLVNFGGSSISLVFRRCFLTIVSIFLRYLGSNSELCSEKMDL